MNNLNNLVSTFDSRIHNANADASAAVLTAESTEAEVEELWLTHYSPSLVRPEEYLDAVRNVFSNTHPGKDGKSVELTFPEN